MYVQSKLFLSAFKSLSSGAYFDLYACYLNEYPLHCYSTEHKIKIFFFLPYKCFDKSISSFALLFLKGLSEAVFNKCFNVFMSFEAI